MKHTQVIAIMLLVSGFFGQALPQPQKPLGNVELLALWIDGTGSERLAKIVVERGIDFQPGADFLQALAEAGAEKLLLDALKGAKPVAAGESSGPTGQPTEAPALAHLIIAVRLNRNGFHPKDAEAECQAAVQADPENAFAHLALGSMLSDLGRWEMAVSEKREALRLRPDLAEAHSDLAWALSGKREWEAAITEFRQAVLLEPGDARAHRGLGQALAAKGDKQAGEEEKRIAEQLDPRASVPKRIRVGGQVMGSKLVHAPRPKYPREAKKAHIGGVVRLMVLIGKDGAIKDLKVESGDAALVKAATEAVSRWTYKPTLLNGQAVEVITEVDVNFTLR